jgi:CTP synthase (UTP-ammonia lyase)
MEKKGIPFSKFTNEMTKYYEVFELNKKKFFLFHAFHKDERCEEYGEQDLDFLK